MATNATKRNLTMKRPRAAVVLSTLALIAAILMPAGAGAQPVNAAPLHQEEPTTRLPYDGVLDLPHLETDAVPPEVKAAELGPEYTNWSKLVFQSYRNTHDWEIFGARGDGSNQANLSNNGSTDMHARLNRGATRVAFSSRRDGNYEIYVMNANGSGQTRLTNNGADDVYPAWSPDGSKIAFQSYRDGQPEIYVMNANGSGQTRITNYGDYDGQPAWSPDSTKIAFIRRQSGQYRVWVMNADGSNPQQRSGQALSQGPVWSPDGTKIAYDSDGDGDGWQEIWLMDAGGGNQSQVYRPGEGNTDAWVRSWSPDGRYVAFSRITWTYYQGQWYWTTAYLDAWDSTTPWNTIRLSNTGYDWHPGWETTDAQAPTSRVQALPAQSPAPFRVYWSGTDEGGSGLKSYDVQFKDGPNGVWNNWKLNTPDTSAGFGGIGGHSYYFRARARDNAENVEPWPTGHDTMTTIEALAPQTSVLPLQPYSHNGVLVRWRGNDPGGSGIQSYDVQYRQGNGAWTDWQMGTSNTGADFTGTIGVEYRFRARARDNAQNIEAWPPGGAGDTSTTLFTWQLGGRLTDNRGTPIARADVQIAPSPLQPISTSAEGQFVAYLSTVGDHSVSINRPGYGPLNPPALAINEDRIIDLSMPPLQNLVTNGGFEVGQPLPSGWTVNGPTDAAAISPTAHTGARSLKLGKTCPYPCLSQPERLADSTGYPDMASDSRGNVYLIFQGGTRAMVMSKSPDGVWSEPEDLGPLIGNSWRVSIAIDGNDVAHVVWSQSENVYHRQRAPGSTWSEPQLIASGGRPDVAADRLGGVHVIYFEIYHGTTQVRYLERLPSGEWQAPVILDDDPFGGAGIAVGPDDSVHFLYEQQGVGVLYRWRPPERAILPAEQLLSFSGYTWPYQNVTVGGDGTVHVAMNGIYEAFYRQRPAGGTWSAIEPLSTRAASALAVDSAGTLHLAGYTGNGPYNLYYRYRTPNGVWTNPAILGRSNSDGPALAIDPHGQLHLGCLLMESNVGMYYWTTANAPDAFTVKAEQQVTVPSTMHRPTVTAFQSSQGANHPLSIWVQDGVSSTQVFSSTETNTWQLAFADLSPWAGQEITLNFMLRQEAGAHYSQVLLDDVTLGEWPTPLIGVLDPAQAPAWTSTSIVIQGDNFINTPTVQIGSVAATNVEWIDEHTLNVVVPGTLAPGFYDLQVTNPGGAASIRIGGFRSGSSSFLPLIVRH